MKTILRFILSSGRERRRALEMALWLLRQIRNAEDEEMQRHSDRLDCFDLAITDTIPFEYNAIEEAYLSCEHALGSLNSAIEDLEYVY